RSVDGASSPAALPPETGVALPWLMSICSMKASELEHASRGVGTAGGQLSLEYPPFARFRQFAFDPLPLQEKPDCGRTEQWRGPAEKLGKRRQRPRRDDIRLQAAIGGEILDSEIM